LLESIRARAAYRPHSAVAAAPRIALLPGSRHTELKYHAPILRGVVERLKARYPRLEVRVPVATTLTMEYASSCFPDPAIRLEAGSAHEVVEWADAAIVSSGTATLETTLIGTPFSLIYVMSPSSQWLAKHFFRYRNFFGMPNLLQGREVIREFVHEKATPDALAAECVRLIDDPAHRETVTQALKGCREKLGVPGASARAARQVLDAFAAARSSRLGAGLAVPEPA
jgi:lipid-A-disaccharide synthase